MKNHSQNAVEKLFSYPFLKIQNWTYLWINNLKFHIVCFYCIPSGRLQIILKRSCRPLAFTSYEAFLKNKKRSRTSLPVSFSAWFLKKIFLLFYSINWPNFIVWLPLIRKILGNMCIVIAFNQVVTSWNLKLTLSF